MIKAIKHWVYNQHRKYVWVLSRIGKQPDAYIPTDKRELYVITIAYNHTWLISDEGGEERCNGGVSIETIK